MLAQGQKRPGCEEILMSDAGCAGGRFVTGISTDV
jgi:hypothetical protein